MTSTNDPVIWPKLHPTAVADAAESMAGRESSEQRAATAQQFVAANKEAGQERVSANARPVAGKLSDRAVTAILLLSFAGSMLLVGGCAAMANADGTTGSGYKTLQVVDVVTLALGQALLIIGAMTCLAAVLIGTIRTR